jgi:hypothetical protein
VDKPALRQIIVAQMEAELALQTEAAHSSHSEATDAENRAEGQYDMRGQSAAYLAEGQAKLASEIAEAIAAYRALPLRTLGAGEPIAVGAVVTLETRGRRSVYFLGPKRGGMDVQLAGSAVTVITAGSSLGRILVGRRAGESIVLPGRTPPVNQTIAAVE